MAVTHLIEWKTTPSKLRQLAQQLEDYQVVNVDIAADAELLIEREN